MEATGDPAKAMSMEWHEHKFEPVKSGNIYSCYSWFQDTTGKWEVICIYMIVEMDNYACVEIQSKLLLLRIFQMTCMIMDATDTERNETHSPPSKMS